MTNIAFNAFSQSMLSYHQNWLPSVLVEGMVVTRAKPPKHLSNSAYVYLLSYNWSSSKSMGWQSPLCSF
jgi:hypothetical protein